MESALARADVCIVHSDRPEWRDLTAADLAAVDFSGMRRKVVIDGRRIVNCPWRAEGPMSSTATKPSCRRSSISRMRACSRRA